MSTNSIRMNIHFKIKQNTSIGPVNKTLDIIFYLQPSV